MPRQSDARARFVDTAASLFRRHGYHGVGLTRIISVSGAPKGSFYHFFASKQDFAEAVMRSYDRQFEDFFDACFQDCRLTPSQQLRTFFDLSIERLGLDGFRGGCLIGTLGQETGATSRALAGVADDIIGRWQRRVESCLKRAADAEELACDVAPAELAQFIVNGWEGAMLRMRLEQSPAPLRNFVSTLFAGYFTTDGRRG